MHRASTRAALLVTGLASCAVEGTGLDLAVSEQAIVNGQADTGEPAVVALTTDGQQFCTGTLVSPRVVVTAAHCLPPHVNLSATSIDVFFGSSLGSGGTLVAATEADVHPAWNEEVVPNDIGLLSLAEDAPVAPIQMIAEGAAATVGESVKLIGFGITVAEGSDNGIKRSGSATIDDSDASTIYLTGSPSLTCNGDSGGPLFVQRGGAWVFAGIHSRSDCATESLNERVDVHKDDRIAPFIAEHGGAGACGVDGVCDEDCAADPDCGPGGGGGVDDDVAGGDLVGGCAAGGDAPAAGGLALVALALLGRGRRRRRR